MAVGLDGEIGRHSGLKIRRLAARRRAGSIPARGTSYAGEPAREGRMLKARKRAGFDSGSRQQLCRAGEIRQRPTKRTRGAE